MKYNVDNIKWIFFQQVRRWLFINQRKLHVSAVFLVFNTYYAFCSSNLILVHHAMCCGNY